MTTKNNPIASPLSNRDPNQQHCDDKNLVTESERIKARFDRDFLPKYGDLWRRMARKKKSLPVETTVSNPFRVLNFADAVERKETVMINGSTLHQDQQCDCYPPIEDFLIEQANTNHTIDLSTEQPMQTAGRSNNTESFDKDGDNYTGSKYKIYDGSKEQMIIDISEEENEYEGSSDENNNSLQSTTLRFDLTRLEITPKNRISAEQDIVDHLVDIEKKTDGEIGSETDDVEEHEWTPDNELDPIDNSVEEHMKPTSTETIDLCNSDSSSYGIGGDSDFTVASDNHDETKSSTVCTKVKKKTGLSSKSSFRKNRDRITNSTFGEFNRDVFGSELGCVEVLWSKKLNTTAGLTRLRRCTNDMTPGVPLKRLAVIELSTKIVDDENRLRETLLHELVHAAVWILEGVSKPPHGKSFKVWAKIAMSKIPDVVVTTTHKYEINYKFEWKCVNPSCSFTIGRHSRSVDLLRHRCGQCKGELMEISSDGTPKIRAQPSAYNLFVKEKSKTVREKLINLSKAKGCKPSQSDVMREVGRLWRVQKNLNK